MNKSLKIMSLEAKDIYAAMNLVNEDPSGYRIRNESGEISLKKFKNTLDYSLDSIKLQDVYWKTVRKKDFFFVRNNKKYTQEVINVTFSFSYKEFNQAGENTFIRAGYSFRDCVFNDGICIQDDVVIGVQTNVAILSPVNDLMLPDYFAFVDGHYELIGSIPVIMNKADLRKYIYDNGFMCDGKRYVRYKRSSGSSRVGKCLFVDEILADKMHKWDRCGIPIKHDAPIDLAAWEAYISLPMSSIIDTVDIPVDSILVVDDYVSTFNDNVVAVEAKNDRLVSQSKDVEIKNSIWDGESLLDKSMFGIYENKGMLLLRNRFFKTCAFNTNIQQWFTDNGITEISQLNGFTLATDVSQIKLITTPSSVKYLKFGTIKDWLKNIESTFGVVKYEKEPHFFDGRMVQCHYQLLNTLQLSKDEMECVLAPSLSYIGAVRSDPDVLRYHIGYSFNCLSEEEQLVPMKNKNDIVFKLLGLNESFSKTKIYKDFRDSIVRGFFRNLRKGHVLLNGNYSTLFGNGMELLKQAIGTFNGESSMPRGCIHSKRFEFGKTILASRSPHITMGNILLSSNISDENIDKYFNLTNEIVCVNAIGENIQQRLNGCDYDSDSMLLTDNEILIEAAVKNYTYFKVPTCLVESQKTARFYNNEHKADLDIKTSVNKIGEIVNLSQQLNSLYWERLHNGYSKDDCEELYNDICKLSVLSGIEIDKAKKEYIINSANEIKWLKEKYMIIECDKPVKPMFFKLITTENGYKLSDQICYRYFNTSMDYLQQIVSSTNFRQARKYKEDLIPFMSIVKKPDHSSRSGYYNILRDKMIDVLREARQEIKKMYIGYDVKDKAEKNVIKESVAELKQHYISLIDKMSEHEYLMYIVLKEIDNKQYNDIRNTMFEIVFGKPNEAFMQMIANSRENMHKLIESNNGNIQYYGFKFEKISA